MRLLGTHTLQAFAEKHANVARKVGGWIRIITALEFGSPAEMKQQLASASVIHGTIVVFEAGGRQGFRVSATVDDQRRVVLIRHVMLHEEYERRSHEGTL